MQCITIGDYFLSLLLNQHKIHIFHVDLYDVQKRIVYVELEEEHNVEMEFEGSYIHSYIVSE